MGVALIKKWSGNAHNFWKWYGICWISWTFCATLEKALHVVQKCGQLLLQCHISKNPEETIRMHTCAVHIHVHTCTQFIQPYSHIIHMYTCVYNTCATFSLSYHTQTTILKWWHHQTPLSVGHSSLSCSPAQLRKSPRQYRPREPQWVFIFPRQLQVNRI